MGVFLNSLGDKFERYGTEIDSSSIEYAINEFPKFSKNIINDDFKNVKFENNFFFDLITMRGVIEHVPDPENCVKEVARILKNNGLFYICATPNGNLIVLTFTEKIGICFIQYNIFGIILKKFINSL